MKGALESNVVRALISIVAGLAAYIILAFVVVAFIGGIIGSLILIPLFFLAIVAGRRLYDKLDPSR